MSAFAKNGNRVLYIENTGVRPPTVRDLPRLKKRILSWKKGLKGFRQLSDNLHIYSPILLPFPYSRIARFFNRYFLIGPLKRWIRAAGFYEPIVWTFLPTLTALGIIDNIPDRRLLVYYCIADFEELVKTAKKIRNSEKRLIGSCDLVFAQGETLQEKCRKQNENVFISPFGVNTEVFEEFQANQLKEAPQDIKDINRPIVGYVGGVHRHIDFSLLKLLAQNRPDWSIVLVGPVQTDTGELPELPNVFILGERKFSQLPSYINEFDVCIIPYRYSGFTDTVYPTKLNEYHMLGKPVVSTALPEVIKFNRENNNLVTLAKTPEEFVQGVQKALSDNNQALSDLRKQSARKNSWQVRIEKMSALMEEAIERRRLDIQARWKENLIRFYILTRRRLMQLGCACIVIYLLLFKSPFVWFLAGPLKVSDAPRQADAIVVFGGGLGEAGRVGQGYEERVEHAVRLYKEGYAPRLLLVSGYAYRFKEAQIMKILAASLGVPQEKIYLRDDARNTYEYVNFTKEIMEKMDWDSILLVSSPYHMRRASLVFDKAVKDAQIIYTPIPKSLYYDHSRGTSLGHIRGILHEYLAIIYYWWKGWV
jgi:uncharacterized SAM-binding protein YcdF (DUF218 family)